jgi:hypothetical protein
MASPEPVLDIDDVDDLSHKRRMEELEIEMFEVEIKAKKLANAVLARNSAREHLIKVTQQYRELCQDSIMDERTRSMLKKGFLNMAKAVG